MPDALSFIKPTLTECNKHFPSQTTGHSGISLSSLSNYRDSPWINCYCHHMLLKVCFMFLINSVSLLMSSETAKTKNVYIMFMLNNNEKLPLFLFYIKPWCRWCWDWGRSGQLSPQRLSCSCCTWDSQKLPARCCSRGRSILCTVLCPFFCRREKQGCILVARQYPNDAPS